VPHTGVLFAVPVADEKRGLMHILRLNRSTASCFTLLILLATASPFLSAQGNGTAAPTPTPAAPPTAKAAAPEDLTGQWISVVTEDWGYRMIMPPKADYLGVPLNPAGRKVADNWDPAKDEAAGEQCKSYGAPAILRAPGRIRISWASDDTLKIEADAGTQSRMLYFKEPTAAGGDWQGVSQASWERVPGGPFFGGGGPRYVAQLSGSLKVVTTKMRPGYLRKNGVPYSDKATLTEFFDRTTEPDGVSLLVVTTVVDDPTYLVQPFIVSNHFRKQADDSGWNPTPCTSR